MRLSVIILVGTAVVIAVAAAFGTLLLAFPEAALAEEAVGVLGGDSGVVQWGFAAAAASAGLSAAAAGYAVAHVGSAAVGALAEKPELSGEVRYNGFR